MANLKTPIKRDRDLPKPLKRRKTPSTKPKTPIRRRSPVVSPFAGRPRKKNIEMFVDPQFRTPEARTPRQPETPSSKLFSALKVLKPDVRRSQYYFPGIGWDRQMLRDDIYLLIK
jgi:hypothetical protein